MISKDTTSHIFKNFRARTSRCIKKTLKDGVNRYVTKIYHDNYWITKPLEKLRSFWKSCLLLVLASNYSKSGEELQLTWCVVGMTVNLCYHTSSIKWKKDRPGSSIKTKIRVPMSTVLSFKFWSVRLCYATFFTYVPRGKCFIRIQWRILRCIIGITEHVITFHILAAYQRYHYPRVLLSLYFLQCHHVAFLPRIEA